MNYYKAQVNATTASGRIVAVADIKASDRIYSHAVITVAVVTRKFYTDGTPNPYYGKRVSWLSFHQGLQNAEKAAQSSAHRCLGGDFSYDDYGRKIESTNHNRSTTIVQTELVSSSEYRNFKKTALRGSQLDMLLNS